MLFKLTSVFHLGQPDVESDAENSRLGKGKRFAW